MLKLFLLHRQISFLYAYGCLVFKYVIAKYAFKMLLILDSENSSLAEKKMKIHWRVVSFIVEKKKP